MAQQIIIGSNKKVRCVWTDEDGNPTTVDPNKAVVVEVDPPNVATLSNVQPDGSADIALVAVGTFQVRATADADRSVEGDRPLTIIGDFECVAKEAVAGRVELTD